MDSKRLEESTEKLDAVNIFETQCPKYMAMGMTYDEYWNGDPWLVKYYREAYKERLRAQNTMNYMQASYIYEVLCDVAPLYDSLAKNRKPKPFRDAPYDMFSEDAEQHEEQRKLDAYHASIERMKAFAQMSKQDSKSD